MRALVTTPDGPEPVALRDVPEPVPGPNEVLVAVHAFSLNRGELRSVVNNGEGWIPGQDIAGVVLSGPRTGQRVVCLTDEFGWAERVAVPAHRIVAIPDSVTFSQACALPVAGLTALRCVRLGGALVGRRVLITGAAGGVGTLAVQIARHAGAQVTAVVGSKERGIGIGAHETVIGIENAPGRYALILEAAGGASLAEALKRIEPNGIVAVYGNSSAEATAIGFADFRAAQNARIQSFFYFTSGPEEQFDPDLSLLVSMVADGSLRPVIGAERSWTEFAPVADQLRARKIPGKAVFLTGVA